LNLARLGVDSILTYNSSRAEAEKVVALVAEAGAKSIALKLDTCDAHGFDPFVDAVVVRGSGIVEEVVEALGGAQIGERLL
ncbi:hypothetical protein ACC687_41295, partial [Rhizobium ruizarguesonis]